MVKTFVLFILLTISSLSFAGVFIKTNISGDNSDRYFLCMPNAGCISLLAEQDGKSFELLHHFGIQDIFVMDVLDRMRVWPQGVPSSCRLSHIDNKTITISGTLRVTPEAVQIVGLSCEVS